MPWRPLEDVLVLDLTQLLPGPFATRLLADLGAAVLTVEPPAGDAARRMPPLIDGDGWIHHALAPGKASVRIDLKTDAGLDTVRRLAQIADVLIESNRPGVLERLGLDLTELRRVNPGLVIVRLTGFGQEGSSRDKSGHDLTYEALAGTLALNGPPERPVPPALPMADTAGALYAVIGILAALHERRDTGQGRVVDLALYDAALAVASPYLHAAAAGHVPQRGTDALTGGLPGYNVYRCADDEWIALAALEPRFFATACRVLGEPAWEARIGDPTLIPEIASVIAMRSSREWMEAFAKEDVPAAPVLSPERVLEHRLFNERAPGGPSPGNPLTGAGGEATSASDRVRAVLIARGAAKDEVARLFDIG